MTSFSQKENRFLDKVWRSGKAGKITLFFYALLAISPLFAEIIAVYSIRDWILSLPTAVTDRIAVLAFLVGSWFFLSSWFAVFLRALMEDSVKK